MHINVLHLDHHAQRALHSMVTKWCLHTFQYKINYEIFNNTWHQNNYPLQQLWLFFESFREYPKANDWLNLAWTVPIVMRLHYRCLIHFYCIRPVGIENTCDTRFFYTATFYILVNLWKNVSMETKQKRKYSWVCYHAVWYTIYSIQQGSELTRIWIYVLLWIDINSLAPGRFQQHFRWVIFMFILVIDDWCISCEIAIRYM